MTSHTTSCSVGSPAGAASPRSVPPGDASQPPNRAGAQLGMCLGKAQPARGLALPLDQRQRFQAGITGMKRRLVTPDPSPVGTAALPAVAGGSSVPVAARSDPVGDGAGWGLPDWSGLEMGDPWQCCWDGLLTDLCSGSSCRGQVGPAWDFGPRSQCQVQLCGWLWWRTG